MTRHQNRRGFSLIESAIVLAVVGLVIGGIWVAANSINRKLRINEASNGILSVIEKARSLYKNMPQEYSAESALYAVGAVPKSWSNQNGFLVTPDGKIGFQVHVGTSDISIQFDHWDVDMDYADCVNLLPMIMRSKELVKVGGSMRSYTRANGRLPMSREHIAEECEYAYNYLELYYNR